jgi:hypothetical protein
MRRLFNNPGIHGALSKQVSLLGAYRFRAGPP